MSLHSAACHAVLCSKGRLQTPGCASRPPTASMLHEPAPVCRLLRSQPPRQSCRHSRKPPAAVHSARPQILPSGGSPPEGSPETRRAASKHGRDGAAAQDRRTRQRREDAGRQENSRLRDRAGDGQAHRDERLGRADRDRWGVCRSAVHAPPCSQLRAIGPSTGHVLCAVSLSFVHVAEAEGLSAVPLDRRSQTGSGYL